MADQTHQTRRTLSPLATRQAVGVLGLLIPVVLYLYARVFEPGSMQPTMSAFYYTPMGDVFVGTLIAVGVFLLTYRGYVGVPQGLLIGDRTAAVLAGAGAIGTALIPTPGSLDEALCGTAQGILRCDIASVGSFETGILTGFVRLNDTVQLILHYLSAFAFIAMMAYFCLALFPIGPRTTGDRKLALATYRICGWIIVAMLVPMVGVGLAGLLNIAAVAEWAKDSHAVFWLEAGAVIAFSVAWLVKGKTLAHPLGWRDPDISH